jgi:hypothetical protein
MHPRFKDNIVRKRNRLAFGLLNSRLTDPGGSRGFKFVARFEKYLEASSSLDRKKCPCIQLCGPVLKHFRICMSAWRRGVYIFTSSPVFGASHS